MIAITGASGALGSRVAHRLADQGRDLRLLVRDPKQAPALAADVAVIGSYADQSGLHRGLTGCDTLFMVSAREAADRVREHRTVIDAAVSSGVRKIVYTSFQGAAPDATFTFARDHWHTERIIADSGLSYVFLRDCFYLAALAGLAGGDGILRGPAGEGAVAGVSHDDVAAVAAAVLVGDRWEGQTLDVTGPEALTLTDVAAQLSAVSGRDVTYLIESEEEAYASRAHYGAPAYEITGWVSSYQAIAAGEVSLVSETVEQVTRRRPECLLEYLQANPASWAHLVGGTPPAEGS